MIRDLYRANFNLRQSSYFVPLLIAHGKHFYEILSCSIGRQEDLIICCGGVYQLCEFELKYDVAFLFSASLSLGCICSLALG